jgi:hypothetical protein
LPDFYEVNWEDKNDKVHYRAFIDPMKACAYYVRERHRRKLGIDYEIAAWKMDKALT